MAASLVLGHGGSICSGSSSAKSDGDSKDGDGSKSNDPAVVMKVPSVEVNSAGGSIGDQGSSNRQGGGNRGSYRQVSFSSQNQLDSPNNENDTFFFIYI